MPNHANASHDRTDLQPLAPADAVRLWIESHVDDWAVATRDLQSYHVEEFTDWLTDDGVDDMRDVSARTVHRFRLEIKNDLAQATLSQRISTVRRFLTFCVSVDAVAPSVPERIEIPKRDGNARTESLETDHAEAALSYLRRFAYASREHALLALTWHTGLRTGTVRALDVSDVETANNRLRVRHRPETDTPLKNGESAERYVTLSDAVTEALVNFIQHNRVATRDDHGREPLFTTDNGRAPVKTLRRWFQTATRPCLWDECPHGRNPDDCDAAQRSRDASDCPSSVSGHPIRRGAITHHLRRDVPEKVVSDRCNVSADVLDEHYDRRSDDEKAEQRRSYLGNI